MYLQKLMRNYAAYNLWANETLIGFLKNKPEELWYREVPSSFNSIARTLNHILATQEYWFSVIAGTKNTHSRYGDEFPDAEELFASLIEHSGLVEDTIGKFSETELVENVPVESPWFSSNLPRYEYIQHLLNHSTYHRGQIITIGRNLGFTDAPMTDYNYYNVYKSQIVVNQN